MKKTRMAKSPDSRSYPIQIEADQVLGDILAVVDAKITDVVQWDANTLSIKSSNEIPLNIAKAIKRMKMKKSVRTDAATGDVIETMDYEVEMYDRLAAIKALGDHLGLFNSKQPEEVSTQKFNLFTNLSADQIRDLKAVHIAKLEALKRVLSEEVGEKILE